MKCNVLVLWLLLSAAFSLFGGRPSLAASGGHGGPPSRTWSSLFAEVEVFQENKRDLSPELKTIPPKPPQAGIKAIIPNGGVAADLPADAPVTGQFDPVVQTWNGPAAMPSTSQNFEGISAHGYMPPDTNGEAGRQHYVQMVNSSLQYASNSTITGPVSIPVAGYTRACSASQICVPQPGVGQKLDSFSDRLMFRLSYRNFGSHQSMVVSRTRGPLRTMPLWT